MFLLARGKECARCKMGKGATSLILLRVDCKGVCSTLYYCCFIMVSFVGKVRVPAGAAPREYTLWHPQWRWRHRTGRYKDGGRSYENKNFALAVHVGGSGYCRARWRSSGAAARAAATSAGRGASSAACANRR